MQNMKNHFSKVFATDISQQQIDQASRKPNIEYRLSPGEKTTFEDGSFDLITVAQAIHWFDFKLFYREVQSLGNPRCLGLGIIENPS